MGNIYFYLMKIIQPQSAKIFLVGNINKEELFLWNWKDLEGKWIKPRRHFSRRNTVKKSLVIFDRSPPNRYWTLKNAIAPKWTNFVGKWPHKLTDQNVVHFEAQGDKLNTALTIQKCQIVWKNVVDISSFEIVKFKMAGLWRENTWPARAARDLRASGNFAKSEK